MPFVPFCKTFSIHRNKKGLQKGTKDTKKNNKSVVDSDVRKGIGILRVLRAFVVNQVDW